MECWLDFFFQNERIILGKSFKEKIGWVKILIKGDSDLQMLNNTVLKLFDKYPVAETFKR